MCGLYHDYVGGSLDSVKTCCDFIGSSLDAVETCYDYIGSSLDAVETYPANELAGTSPAFLIKFKAKGN